MNSTKPTCILCKALQSIFFLIVLYSYSTHVNCEQTNGTNTCAEVYEKGVEAYLNNKFPECVSYLENALVKYREYSKTLHNCRLKCRDQADQSKPLYDMDIENLLFFEKILKNTLCLVKCKTSSTLNTEKYNLNEELENVFDSRKPYEYLHLCYFQVKDLQKAASAAFTYLISHPEDKTMLATLKYYSSFDGVDMNEIVNYEAREYVYLYSHGAAAYEKKDWKSVINNMEESLTDYLQAEEECRAQCEGPFDHGWLPDFVPSIANHFTYCLKCKSRCSSSFNSINGEKYEDLLPSHYHYLQYSYFKVGSLKEACQAVASFLLFFPEDKTMIDNKEYYLKLPNVNPDFFKPRSEALKYIQRKTYEDKLLKYIEKEFQADKLIVEDFSKGNFLAQHLLQKFIRLLCHEETSEKLMTRNSKVEIVKIGPDFKSAYRFVAEGLLRKNQCSSLVDIVKKFSIYGDGYDTGSPHTKMETFKGMSLERAISLSYYGLLKLNHLKMILELSEEAKQVVTRYFRLGKPLYYTYTHLVCRSALRGISKNRTDLSHEIHADNCNIYPDGVCEKQPPSYIWRDYSAIIYLNNDFDGGEFFFSSNTQPESIETIVTPVCGRMVAFSSGSENLHGVNAVRKGSRCALALWFTFDEIHREKVRDWVYDFLDEG